MEDQWLVPLPKRAGDSTSIQCLYCNKDFRTEAAERRHVSEEHPDESSLRCPACKAGGFKTPSDLMGHIERGVCERLSLKELNRRRMRKLAFRQALGLQGPVRHNFSRFIDRHAPNTTQGPLLLTAGAGVNEPSRQSSVSSMMTAPSTDTSRAPSVVTVRSDGTANSNTALMAGRQHRVSNHQDLVDEYEMGDDGLIDVQNDIDKCWNKFSEKYHCPRSRCPKTFKSSASLLAHLRSPAHSNVRYTCPECHKELHCLQGMTAHAEDPASRCGISRTDKFAIYMEQLTGGLVDVVFVDGGNRVKYETSQVAEAEFEHTLVARSDGYDGFHKQEW